VRIQHEDLEWHDGSLWWWTEGNFGCDCNSEDEWLRAGGVAEKITPDNACGDKRFSVLYADLPDGTHIQIDEQ
jgi:hypothetical protein